MQDKEAGIGLDRLSDGRRLLTRACFRVSMLHSIRLFDGHALLVALIVALTGRNAEADAGLSLGSRKGSEIENESHGEYVLI